MFRSFFPSLVATSDSPSAEKDGAVTSSQEAASSKGDDAAGTENKAVANRIQKMDSIIRWSQSNCDNKLWLIIPHCAEPSVSACCLEGRLGV